MHYQTDIAGALPQCEEQVHDRRRPLESHLVLLHARVYYTDCARHSEDISAADAPGDVHTQDI